MRARKWNGPPPGVTGSGPEQIQSGDIDAKSIPNSLPKVEGSKRQAAGRVVFRLSPNQARLARRVNEIIRLVDDRMKNGILTDQGAVATLIADARIFSGEVELRHLTRYGIEDDIAASAIHSIERLVRMKVEKGEPYRSIPGSIAGYWLQLVKNERTRLDIRTMYAVDETREERIAAAEGRKRERDRLRQREKRLGKTVQRHTYEANSIEQARPWEAEGISRRTWYRRRK